MKLPQIYATLYLMIHSKDICDMLSTISWKMLPLNLSRNSFLGKIWQFGSKLDQDYATLYLMIWSKNFFEKFYRDSAGEYVFRRILFLIKSVFLYLLRFKAFNVTEVYARLKYLRSNLIFKITQSISQLKN